MTTDPIVSRVWGFCTTLRDDGVSYGDYLEQLTYLIFLKMADEYSRPPHGRKVGIPAEYGRQSLRSRRGAELEGHYIELLRELGGYKGMLGQIFTKAQNKIQDPAKFGVLFTAARSTCVEYPQEPKERPVMTAITFDTLKYAERLKAAGVPEPQAKAEAEALAEALAETVQVGQLATKADIADVKREIADVKADMMRWMAGMLIAQAALISALVKLL